MAREVGKKVDILLPPGTEQSWAYKAYMEASMAPHELEGAPIDSPADRMLRFSTCRL